MARYASYTGHRRKTYWYLFICMSLFCLLCSCNDDSAGQESFDGTATASSANGSASFSIQWHEVAADRDSTVLSKAIESCETAGVASITCEVYDESGSQIASGGPWDCSDHHGTIENIPAGANRMIAALGWSGTSGNGDIVFQGQTGNNITINPGEIAAVGTIDAYTFVPTLSAPDDKAQVNPTTVSLEWEPLENADEYLVQIAEDSAFETIIVDETTPATTHAPETLAPTKEYFWKIAAIDINNNIGADSEVRSFMTLDAPVISGFIRTSSGAGIGGVLVTFSNNGGTATTDGSGAYNKTIDYGWSGSATPAANGYTFEPASLSYENVSADQSNQDFTGAIITQVISGYIQTSSGTPISGVTLTFSNNGGSVSTNSSGYYSNTVAYGWSGSVTPAATGVSFSPPSRSYESVTTDQTAQNFTGSYITPVISGYVRTSSGTGIGGVTLTFSNNGGSVSTNTAGYYSNTVAYGWSGSVTPSRSGYRFSPPNNSYSNVTTNQSNQNFTGSPLPDYVITELTASSTSILAGLTVDIISTIKNQGGSPTVCINLGVYLSTNTTITTSDTLLTSFGLKSCNLAPDGSYRWSMSVTIPENTPTGYYYIGVIADVDQYEAESNENNNTRASQQIYIYHLL